MRILPPLACILALSFGAPALAGDFPGKGSRLLWGYALQDFNLGNYLSSQQRYDEAVVKYQEAIDRYAFDPDFFTNMGLAFYNLADYPHAEAAFKHAISLNAKDWAPVLNLANVYNKQDRLKDALATYQKLLLCSPPAAERENALSNINGIKRILDFQKQKEARAAAEAKAKQTQSAKTATQTGSRSKQARSVASSTKVAVPAQAAALGETKADPRTMEKSGWDYDK